MVCETALVHRGKTVAHLDARLTQHGVLVAAANGHYAVFKAAGVTPRPPQPGAPGRADAAVQRRVPSQVPPSTAARPTPCHTDSGSPSSVTANSTPKIGTQ